MEQDRFEVRAIGIVRSPAREATDERWGSVVSEIRLRPELADGLRGLQTFSHAVIVFLMHEASFSPGAHLVRHPRDRQDLPALGIFAQRGKHRPNLIGVSVVRVVRVEGPLLVVQGLDAIDGTPVIHIKPHFPLFDAPDGATVPDWVPVLMKGYF